MLSFSPEKLFIVGLIALLVLGPNRLPEAIRTVGRFVGTVRRMSAGFQEEVRDALAEPRDAFHAAVGDARPPDVRRSVRDVMSASLSPPTSSPGDHRESSTVSSPTQPPDERCEAGPSAPAHPAGPQTDDGGSAPLMTSPSTTGKHSAQ